MSYEQPYKGIKVVDLSQGIAGPYCAMLLAQYGADVVKVEPFEGDWARILGTTYGDHSAFSIAGNLGKRSIALDLKSPAGREIVEKLIEEADVFMGGFRPGVIQRLGFSYEEVARRNPKLLYLSISGFSQQGPLSSKPAMDPVLQAFSGFMMENKGQDGIPHRANPIVVDMSTALYCFQAVSAALYAKRDESKGRFIDASLMAAAANLQIVRMMAVYLEKGEMKAPSAPSGTFPTKDGFIQIVVLRDKDYVTLCNCLGLPDLGADPRFQTRDDRVTHSLYLTRMVTEALASRTTAEWTAILTEAKLQNEAVLDYMQFLKHPHIQAIDLISWLNHSGFPEPIPVPNPPGTVPLADGMPTAHAPHLGEHTTAVLAELGYSPDAVEAMRGAKAIMG